MSSWDDILGEADSEQFIGREYEITTFTSHLTQSPPKKIIYYLYGQGGVGKTTLLNEFQKIAHDQDFLTVTCDERHRDVPKILGFWAEQLYNQGINLNNFLERYRTYRQHIDEIERDPAAPKGLAEGVGKFLMRETIKFGEKIPFLGEGIRHLPQESLEQQAGEWTAYITKKFSNKDELLLVREPLSILAPIFFEDLNKISNETRVILCFDNFESLPSSIEIWLNTITQYKPSHAIRLMIAGRNVPSTRWEKLRNVMWTVALEPFSEHEANSFLDLQGVIDINERLDIIQLSGRLPVLMSLLTVNNPQGIGVSSTPTNDIVERFLRWVIDTNLRKIALNTSIARIFDQDILKVLLDGNKDELINSSNFEWLCNMPFISETENGWKYHPVVRRIMLRYQRNMSQSQYRKSHDLLCEFYKFKSKELLKVRFSWSNKRWQEFTKEYLYHLFCSEPDVKWVDVLGFIAHSLWNYEEFALDIINLFLSEEVFDELNAHQIKFLTDLQEGIFRDNDGSIKVDIEKLNILGNVPGLKNNSKIAFWNYSGKCYLRNNDYKKACMVYTNVINLEEDNIYALKGRSFAYWMMNEDDKALNDINKAISINPHDKESIARRGNIYAGGGDYDKAIDDFNLSISIYPENSYLLSCRGRVYGLMGEKGLAVKDFSEAIRVNPQDYYAFNCQGRFFDSIDEYEQAIASFTKAIELNKQDLYSILLRGISYKNLKKYKLSLEDFNTTIRADPQHTYALVLRAEVYELMGCYDLALDDLSSAIAIQPNNEYYITTRCELYMSLGEYNLALKDINFSIGLDSKDMYILELRAHIYKNLYLYDLALNDFLMIKLIENEWSIENEIGLILNKLGRYNEAEEIFLIHHQNEPFNIQSLYNLIVTRAYSKSIEYARLFFNKLKYELLNQEQEIQYYGLGGLEALEGNLETALDFAQKAVSIDIQMIEWLRHDCAWNSLKDNAEFISIINVSKYKVI